VAGKILAQHHFSVVLGEAVEKSGLGVVVVLTVGLEAPVPWDGYVDEQFDELPSPKNSGSRIATW